MSEHSFENTRKALEVYDREAPQRDQLWNDMVDMLGFNRAQEADRKALEAVQDAFFEDTKSANSLDQCRSADLGFIRMVVRRSL